MKPFELLKAATSSMKLKTQLIISFVVICLAIMLVGLFITYNLVTDIFKKNNEDYTLNMFRKDEMNINGLINEVDKLSKLTLVNEDYQKLLAGNFSSELEAVETRVKVFNLFSSVLKNYEYINTIYSYGENGDLLGVSQTYSDYLLDLHRDSKYFNSDLYKEVKAAKNMLVWPGVYKEKLFNFEGDRNYDDTNILPAIRKTGVLIQTNTYVSANLIINIDESKLLDVYNDYDVTKKSKKYIVNDKGVIISHPDRNQIGQVSQIYSKIDKSNQYGSFTVTDPADAYHVVYYKIKGTDWRIIREVPIRVVLKDVYIIRNIIIFVFLLSLLAMFFLSVFWIYKLTRPLNTLKNAMGLVESGDLSIQIKDLPHNELGYLGRQFNKMTKSIRELMENNIIIEREKKKMEIEALQMQINPHFIFNTINIIRWMAIIAKNKNIEKSLYTFGNLLRPVFRESNPLWTFAEEMEFVKNYLEIINLRFGEKIKIDINVQEQIMNHKVLKFMLQPFIENTFTHGFVDDFVQVRIKISTEITEEEIHVLMKDDASGIEEERINSINKELSRSLFDSNRITGIGISNVNRRIKLHFGEKYGVKIESAVDKGTEILIILPKSQ